MKIILVLLVATMSLSSSKKVFSRQPKNLFDNNFFGGVSTVQQCGADGACVTTGGSQPQHIGGQVKNDFNAGVQTVQQCGATGSCNFRVKRELLTLLRGSSKVFPRQPKNLFGNNFFGGVSTVQQCGADGACVTTGGSPPQHIGGQVKNDFNAGVHTVQQCGATGSCNNRQKREVQQFPQSLDCLCPNNQNKPGTIICLTGQSCQCECEQFVIYEPLKNQVRGKRSPQFDNNFMSGVGSIQNCTPNEPCYSSSAIPESNPGIQPGSDVQQPNNVGGATSIGISSPPIDRNDIVFLNDQGTRYRGHYFNWEI